MESIHSQIIDNEHGCAVLMNWPPGATIFQFLLPSTIHECIETSQFSNRFFIRLCSTTMHEICNKVEPTMWRKWVTLEMLNEHLQVTEICSSLNKANKPRFFRNSNNWKWDLCSGIEHRLVQDLTVRITRIAVSVWLWQFMTISETVYANLVWDSFVSAAWWLMLFSEEAVLVCSIRFLFVIIHHKSSFWGYNSWILAWVGTF